MRRYAICWTISILLTTFDVAAQLSHDLTRWVPHRFPNARKTHVTITDYLPSTLIGYYDYRNQEILLLIGQGTTDHVIAHEVGHAIWWRDLSLAHRMEWCMWIHPRHRELFAVYRYPDSCSHSFAEAFGEYVAEPAVMRGTSPSVYGWFRNLTGTEFSTAQSWAHSR